MNKDFLHYNVLQGTTLSDVGETDGAFGEMTRVKLDLELSGVKGSRQFTVSDIYTLGGKTACELVASVADHQGFESELIDENGLFVPTVALERMRNTLAYTPNDLQIFAREVDSQSWDDSQDALLYNMLISAYNAQWLQKHKGKYVSPRVPAYQNGHVRIDRASLMGIDAVTEPTELAWALTDDIDSRFEDEDYMTQCVAVTKYPVLQRPVLSVNGMARVDAAWTLMHTSGRLRLTDFAYDVNIPRLASRVYYTGVSLNAGDFDTARAHTTDARKAWRALDSYVVANQLQAAFARVWHMFIQTAVNVLPLHAEAHVWLHMRPKLRLPTFSACRGVGSWLFGSKPYALNQNALLVPSAAKAIGGAAYAIAARYKALALWGLYRFACVAGRDWDEHELTVGQRPAFGFGPGEMPTLIAYATGRRVPVQLLGDEGLVLNAQDVVARMWDTDWLEVSVLARPLTGFWTREEDGRTYVASRGPQWPGATAAAIGQEWLVTAGTALAPISKANMSGDGKQVKVEVGQNLNNLAAYYRWAGFDLHLEAYGGVRWNAFAPNCDSTVPTVLLPLDDPDNIHVVRVTHTSERAKSWIGLPPIHLAQAAFAQAKITRLSSAWTTVESRRVYAPQQSMPALMSRGASILIGLPAAPGIGRQVGYIMPPAPDEPMRSDFIVELPHGPGHPPTALSGPPSADPELPDPTVGVEG